jgi:hypothetical protein
MSVFVSRCGLLSVREATTFGGLNQLRRALAVCEPAIVVLELDFAVVAVQVLAADGMVRPVDLPLEA